MTDSSLGMPKIIQVYIAFLSFQELKEIETTALAAGQKEPASWYWHLAYSKCSVNVNELNRNTKGEPTPRALPPLHKVFLAPES